MLTSKLRALDSEDSEDRDDSNDSIPTTKEALEQRALSQYQEALQLERLGKWVESEEILRELLNSEVLCEVEGKVCGSSKTSFAHLKYCVTMNLGHCLIKQSKLEEGLQYYLKATELDDTDLNLWYKIGLVAMKVPDLNLAMTAFEEGLRCSPDHWGCLDNLVTVCYSLTDLLSCLFYISKGLCKDIGFIKGHAFRDKIFIRAPSLKTDFPLFYPECKLPELGTIVLDKDVVEAMYKEADELREKHIEKWRLKSPPPVLPLTPEKPLSSFSWLHLGNLLLQLHETALKQYPDQPIFRPVEMDISIAEDEPPVEDTTESSTTPCESTYENDKQGEDSDQVDKSGCGYERWVSSQKRRSARVRSTIRREEPSLARSLAHIIPPNLLPFDEKKDINFEDSLHTMDLYRLFETKESYDNKSQKNNVFTLEERKSIMERDAYFGTKIEKEDVENFINENTKKKNSVVDYISEFLNKTATLWKLLWPEVLKKIYLKAFKIHMIYHQPAVHNGATKRTLEDDLAILMFGELLVDHWVNKGKQKGRPSPLGKSMLGGDFPSLYLGKLETRSLLCEDPEILSRIFWLETVLFYHTGEIETTTLPLEHMLNEEWFGHVEVVLPNIQNHYLINNEIVSSTLRSLRRNKNLGEVSDLYNEGNFEEVTEILSDSLMTDQNREDDVLSRPMQFAILLDSYWKLCKFKECLQWGEFYLFETVNNYRNAADDEERMNFAMTVVNTLQGIMSLINTVGTIIFSKLQQEKLIRLVQTLSNIICIQMEAPDSSEMPIETVDPWIILHYIIKHDEECRIKKGELVVSTIREEDETPLASISILHQGHEYLGRRGWCCFSEGSLLYHTLDVIYPGLMELNPDSQAMISLSQQIDQIFHCLYGQQRKTKGRHIVDHNSFSLALTWTRAQQVFRFTRPKELPSYDSSGKCCISTDTEALYLKLITLVPESCDPNRLVPEMTKYIEGESEEVPKNCSPLPEEIADIYYLLAHYYFRNKSWNKVLKFYLLDVCANPNRVDSWACLALARGSLIETKINSCETIKNENEILKSAAMVCRCYDRSLRLDPLQSTLWIEKGSFSYMLHSFCSNLLKKEQNLSLEMFDVLENKKDSMLNVAFDSFNTANKIWYSCSGQDIQDERWLHQYMMGKIAEKRELEPDVFINHYLKASELLHEMGAPYPSNICYATPQHLAVESLEMYYRVHVSILKNLEKSEGKSFSKATLNVFKQAVNKMSHCPFVLQRLNSKSEEIPVKSEGEIKEENEPEVKQEVEEPAEFQTNEEVRQTLNELVVRVCASLGEHIEVKKCSSDSEPATSDSTVKLSNKPMKRPRGTSSDSDPATSDSTSKTSSKIQKTTESSSDSSSSSSDSSSDSSYSSDSSSDSEDTDSSQKPKKPKTEVEPEDPVDWEKDTDWLTWKCLDALELCSKRFQEHFKSLYHSAYFYFKNKKYKKLDKVKQLLFDQGGLFYERKPSNFFNGIWRIPNNEIDRPGSFAAHMGRCVHLLLDFLIESKDYKMLVDLALHLKIVPEPDKKYLRDNEREELFKEALSLSCQSLRKKLPEVSGDTLKNFLMDVYFIYKKVLKSNIKDPVFGIVLGDAYFKLTSIKSDNNVEAAIKYCKQERAAQRAVATAAAAAASAAAAAATTSTPVPDSVQSAPPTTQTVVQPFTPSISKSSHTDDTDNIIVSSVNRSRGGSAVRGGANKRPRGRPPLSQVRARQSSFPSFTQAAASFMQHCTTLLQQNPEWCRQIMAMSQPGSPIPQTQAGLSITPITKQQTKATGVGPAPSQTKPSITPTLSSSISITSVSQTNPKPPSVFTLPQSVSITPAPANRQTFVDPKNLSVPSRPELSLQHKLLSAKRNNTVMRPSSPRAAPLPRPLGLLPRGVPRPTPRLPAPRPNLPLPRGVVPRMVKRAALPTRLPLRPEILSQLSITPTSVKGDLKAPPRFSSGPPPPKIPHLDSSVAEAIRNFGTTITITPSLSVRPAKLEPNISLIPTKPNPPSASTSKPSELPVIVLDD